MAFLSEMFGRRPGSEAQVAAPAAPEAPVGKTSKPVEMTPGTPIKLGAVNGSERPGIMFSEADKHRIQQDAQQRASQRGGRGGYGARLGGNR